MKAKKKSKAKFPPRGPSQQRSKSWSKQQEAADPRRQRKRGKIVWLDEGYQYFKPA